MNYCLFLLEVRLSELAAVPVMLLLVITHNIIQLQVQQGHGLSAGASLGVSHI